MGVEQRLVDKKVGKIRRAWELGAAEVVGRNQKIMWGRVAPELKGLGPLERQDRIAEIEAQIRAAGARTEDYYSSLKKRDRLKR